MIMIEDIKNMDMTMIEDNIMTQDIIGSCIMSFRIFCTFSVIRNT